MAMEEKLQKELHTGKSTSAEEKFRALAKKEQEEVLTSFSADPNGLSEEERRRRLEEYGGNDLSEKEKHGWFYFLLHSFMDAFIIVLLILSFVTYLLERDLLSASIILVLACMSALIRFVQDYGSYRDMQKLRDMEHDTVRIRVKTEEGTKVEEIPVEELVPGDIELIGSGDIVSGDLYLLESKDLFLSVSAFTGESVPVEKRKGADRTEGNAAELQNICLSGSTVNSGTGVGVICFTGKNTYLGSISSSIHKEKKDTDFDRSLAKITRILITYMVLVVIFVLLINGLVKKNWLEAFLFAISVAVGITPGMLPMIVNGTLAKGAQFLAKKKTIVKNMSSIQNLGAVDVLCTDKTGTLTQDNVILQEYLGCDGKSSHLVLNYSWMNAFYSTGVKNVIDRAILAYGKQNHVDQYAGGFVKTDEIPYDFERRRMSVLIRTDVEKISEEDRKDSLEGKNKNLAVSSTLGTENSALQEVLPGKNEEVLITKGAVESVLSCCSRVRVNKTYMDMADFDEKRISALTDSLNQQGMHIIGVAAKKREIEDAKVFHAEDENNMTFLGIVAFLDPPKEDAKEAIQGLYHAGVQVKVISGDAPVVVEHVCGLVGVKGADKQKAVTGTELDELSEEELSRLVEERDIFARLSPMQKKRVVNAIQKNGHVVGYMGDGVNDAPSLHDADVGISVDNATDVAKASADIILLEKSLMVILNGIHEGRRIYGNILKYMKMALSGNFGNVFSVLIASLFLPFLPILPLQILIQNLIYDFTQIAIPWDNVDEEFLQKPHKWKSTSLSSFMNVMGGVSSVFDVLTFLVLWFFLGYNSMALQNHFQTGWFIEGLISQILIVQFIRTSKRPILDSHCDVRLAFASILGILSAVLIPYVFAPVFKDTFTKMPANYFVYLLLILFLYCISVETVKKWYIRYFGEWL